MPQVFVGDLLTGRGIKPLPYRSYRWQISKNRADTLEATIWLEDPDVRELGLRNLVTGGKAFLAILEDDGPGWFAAAGPIPSDADDTYDWDSEVLTIPADGIWKFYDDRFVLPPAARTADTTTWLVPDPSDPQGLKTMPNPAYGTTLSNVDYATMIKLILNQARAQVNSSIPLVFAPDVVGNKTKSYAATDFKRVSDAIADITKLVAGPDVDFQPRFQSDRLGVEWFVRIGTDAQPALTSPNPVRWTLDARRRGTQEATVKGLTGGPVARRNAAEWATGGRAADQAIVERATSTFLTDLGFPYREGLDSSHTDAGRDTLQQYAGENLALSSTTASPVKFQVRKDIDPKIGTYFKGDRVELTVRGDGYFEDGVIAGRISDIASDQGYWATITLED